MNSAHKSKVVQTLDLDGLGSSRDTRVQFLNDLMCPNSVATRRQNQMAQIITSSIKTSDRHQYA